MTHQPVSGLDLFKSSVKQASSPAKLHCCMTRNNWHFAFEKERRALRSASATATYPISQYDICLLKTFTA